MPGANDLIKGREGVERAAIIENRGGSFKRA